VGLTYEYASPEQFGLTVVKLGTEGARTDIYSFGMMLTQLLDTDCKHPLLWQLEDPGFDADALSNLRCYSPEGIKLLQQDFAYDAFLQFLEREGRLSIEGPQVGKLTALLKRCLV